MRFIPRYYGLAAAHLAGLSAWALLVRRRRGCPAVVLRSGLLGLTLVDLLGFGLGLNPAIDRADDRPVTPLIAHLRRVAPPPMRVLGVGEELPPNVAMRYGLADIRNYDSIELVASLDFFATLYPPGPGSRTSRRDVTWAGVIRARDRLREAGVAAIVAATPPPEGAFADVDRVGSVWVARPGPGRFATPADLVIDRPAPGRFIYQGQPAGSGRTDSHPIVLDIQETSDGNWSAPDAPSAGHGPFIHAPVSPGKNRGNLAYVPRSFMLAAIASAGLAHLGGFRDLPAVFALTHLGRLPSTRIVLLTLGRSRVSGPELDSPTRPDQSTDDIARKRR